MFVRQSILVSLFFKAKIKVGSYLRYDFSLGTVVDAPKSFIGIILDLLGRYQNMAILELIL